MDSMEVGPTCGSTYQAGDVRANVKDGGVVHVPVVCRVLVWMG